MLACSNFNISFGLKISMPLLFVFCLTFILGDIEFRSLVFCASIVTVLLALIRVGTILKLLGVLVSADCSGDVLRDFCDDSSTTWIFALDFLEPLEVENEIDELLEEPDILYFLLMIEFLNFFKA